MLWSEDCEEGLIGAILDEPALLPHTGDLSPTDFYATRHQLIWEAILDLRHSGKSVGANEVAEWLKAKNVANQVGVYPTLYDISEAGAHTTPKTVRYLAGKIIDYARRRHSIQAAKEFMQHCEDPDKDVDVLLEKLNLNAKGQGRQHTLSIKQAVDKTLETWHDQRTSGIPLIVRTGIRNLDRLIQLVPGEWGVIGGREKAGKSSLVRQMIVQLAKRRQSVFYITTEMNHESVIHCLMAHLAKVPIQYVRDVSSRLKTHDESIAAAAAELSSLPIEINSIPGISLTQLVNEIELAHFRSDGLNVVVLDHIHELTGREPRESEHSFLSRATSKMLQLAQELNCIFICVSQLSRAGEYRESSSIDQRAAWCVKIYDEGIALEGMSPGDKVVDIRVERARFIASFHQPFLFRGKFYTFEDLTNDQLAAYQLMSKADGEVPF